MTRVLSLCTGMGLMDRAFLDAGFDVVAGCEIEADMRDLYRQVCGGEHLVADIHDLPELLTPGLFDGVIGGPPCQSHTTLRAMRAPRYPDETEAVRRVLDAARPRWFLFENVRPVNIPDAARVPLNAMHFYQPHQSRRRWFTFSAGLRPPQARYAGTVDDLKAYPVVAGRIYGPQRGAWLQGYGRAASLKAPSKVLQHGLAQAVPYPLAREWAESIKRNGGSP
jgi:hypothetical protein